MTHNQKEMLHAGKTLVVLRLHAVFLCQCFTGSALVHLHKGKVSTAAVTLGNILLPVRVAHIRPLCYRCHGLHFPLTPTEELSVQCDLWRFLHVWQMSLFYLYYLLCFCLTHLSNSCNFWVQKKRKKKKKDNGVRIFMNVSCGCGRSPWSVTNLCPVVLLWPLRDIWMYVWLPGPALFSRPVLYVFFLILGCTSGKRLPSTPQYVPQWHFTCVLVRVFVSEKMNACLCQWIEIANMRLIRLEVQNVFEDKTSKRQIMMGD